MREKPWMRSSSGNTERIMSDNWINAAKQKPRPGRKVLVCGQWQNGNRWRGTATWQPAGTMDATCWDDPPEDWWDEDGTVCVNPTDEWFEATIESESGWILEHVTHWMPLPKMPHES